MKIYWKDLKLSIRSQHNCSWRKLDEFKSMVAFVAWAGLSLEIMKARVKGKVAGTRLNIHDFSSRLGRDPKGSYYSQVL